MIPKEIEDYAYFEIGKSKKKNIYMSLQTLSG